MAREVFKRNNISPNGLGKKQVKFAEVIKINNGILERKSDAIAYHEEEIYLI